MLFTPVSMKNWQKNKSKINLVIDAIMFVVIMAVAGLGLLIKYVLLPGYKINEIYGSGTELYFWGLDRHQWGTIHLYLALFLVILLLLHIILHWDMIVCIFRQMIAARIIRYFLAISIAAVGLFLALAPLNIKPKATQLERRHSRNRVLERPGPVNSELNRSITGNVADPVEKSKLSQGRNSDLRTTSPIQENANSEADEIHHHQNKTIDINGTMTLKEISAMYNITISEMAEVIKIPADYADERLGRLKRIYGFDLNDLREFISNRSDKGKNQD
jgi:hypothetical protein